MYLSIYLCTVPESNVFAKYQVFVYLQSVRLFTPICTIIYIVFRSIQLWSIYSLTDHLFVTPDLLIFYASSAAVGNVLSQISTTFHASGFHYELQVGLVKFWNLWNGVVKEIRV